jgi:ubiquinone/menaquinone biosynthesis C-methylase UbiE/uncharacterized protein YbaR (Trm112 family)
MNIWLEILRCPLHPDSGLLNPVKIKGKYTDSGLECRHCGNVYPIIDNIPDMIIKERYKGSFLETEAKQWDLHAPKYEERRKQSQIYMAGIDAAVEALQPERKNLILDAGCGTGFTIKKYHNQDVHVIAFDISMESLRYLRSTLDSMFPITFVRGDLCALPFSSGIFDRVLCANAITHIPGENERAKAVKEFSRVAKSRSRIVISVHNVSISKKNCGWRKEGPAGSYSGRIQYIYRFGAAEFHSLLASSLNVEKIIGAGLPLPYRFKLSSLSQWLERILRRFKFSTLWGNMLVGKCYKP